MPAFRVSLLLCALAGLPTNTAAFGLGTRANVKRPVPAAHCVMSTASPPEASKPRNVMAKEVFSADDRPVLLYDGVCNMCNTFVTTLLDLDKDGKFRFTALQGPTGRGLLEFANRSPTDISSIVLVEKSGECRVQSDAVLRIGRLLGGPVGALMLPGILVPKFLRDRMYDTVADNRYSFMGKREECRCSDDRYADRFI